MLRMHLSQSKICGLLGALSGPTPPGRKCVCHFGRLISLANFSWGPWPPEILWSGDANEGVAEVFLGDLRFLLGLSSVSGVGILRCLIHEHFSVP